jgi:hypothetical protein
MDIMRAGGLLQAGAHGQQQGVGFHWEIGMIHQGGLSIYETLYAGTQGINT